MKDSQFIVIQGWMINKLELKGNELIIFAIIYGFSHEKHCKFTGSLSYMEKATNTTRNSVKLAISKLIEKGFIQRNEVVKKGMTFYEYFSLVDGGSETDPLGGSITDPNNIDYNIEDNIVLEKNEIWEKLTQKNGLSSSWISIMKDLYSLTDQQLEEQFEYWLEDKEESDLEEFSKVKNSLSKWIKDYAQKNKIPLIEKHNEVFRVIHNDEEYVTSLAKRWGCEVRQVQKQIADFREMLLLKEEYKESIQKAKTHYLNWVASGNQIESKKKVYIKS